MITWQKVRVIQLSSVMKSRGSLCSHFFADIWFLLRNGVTSACSPNLMKPRLMSMSLSNKSRSRCRHPSLEQWADNFHVVRWKKMFHQSWKTHTIYFQATVVGEKSETDRHIGRKSNQTQSLFDVLTQKSEDRLPASWSTGIGFGSWSVINYNAEYLWTIYGK